MTEREPTLEQLADAARRAGHQGDAYEWVRETTNAHRARHHCSAYPFSCGPALGALARGWGAARVLELGTALGYTACWWAEGGASVDTIDADREHVELAERTVEAAGLGDRVTVHEGRFERVLADLRGPYDAAFFDGGAPTAGLLEMLADRSAHRGLIVTTNLGFAARGLMAALERLGETAFVDDNLALTIVT